MHICQKYRLTQKLWQIESVIRHDLERVAETSFHVCSRLPAQLLQLVRVQQGLRGLTEARLFGFVGQVEHHLGAREV
ncbi:hypothetical protein LXEBMM8_EKPBGFGD_00921 [Lactiplantibacillus xiangfangensis]